jgi:subfamily B ATP-binding cassette protein MsbA
MVKDYLIHTYGGLPREALQVAILVWTLYTISPELLLQFSIVVFPMAIAVRVVGKTLKRRTKKALVQSSQLTEWLQQRLLGVETIKHHGTEELELTKMAAVAGLLEQRMVRSIIVKALSAPVMQLFVGIATALVLFIATDVTRFRGDVVMSFFATVALLSQSAGKMGRYLAAMSQGQAAIGRLRATLTQISGSEQKISASKNVGDKTYLELDQVTIRYPNAPRPAIENLTAKFEPGKFYVLCGHSGAGKSSVMRAVLGLTPIHGGKINIGVKQDIDWPIVFVPQTIALAPLSIAENVSYPDAAVDTVKLQKALVAAGMEREIAAMPDGAETIVGESGQALSGGQMQRLLLARAFYHDNPFVLIDEGTSALDPGKELIVLHGCKELARAGRCVIMIAHRPKALEYADCVLVLADGKRVAWGSPDDAQVKSAISGSL